MPGAEQLKQQGGVGVWMAVEQKTTLQGTLGPKLSVAHELLVRGLQWMSWYNHKVQVYNDQTHGGVLSPPGQLQEVDFSFF